MTVIDEVTLTTSGKADPGAFSEKLIVQLFRSLTEETPWLSFLKTLDTHFDSHHATMVLRRPRLGDPGVVISTQSNTAALILLQQSMYQETPFLDIPNNEICILSEMMSRQELTTLHAKFYAYIQGYGATEDLMGINMEEPETGMVFRLRCARLSGQPSFSEQDRDKLMALIPWLRIAIGIYAKLAKRDYQLNISDVTEDALATGSMVVDERGQVLATNSVSELVIQNQDGLLLRSGHLHCAQAEDDRVLQSHLRRLCHEKDPHAAVSMLVTRRDERQWSLMLRRIPPQPGIEEAASSTILILFRDPTGAQYISEELLMELFSLTRAESSLVKHLVEGDSLADAAEQLGRSKHTARAQLATIFSKTGVRRQSQLISHVLRTTQQMWGE